jgi:hypothetical protein
MVDGGAYRRRKAADGGAAAVLAAHGWRSDGDEGEGEEASGKRARVRSHKRSREKYDMWTPQIFLSPVDPTLRF